MVVVAVVCGCGYDDGGDDMVIVSSCVGRLGFGWRRRRLEWCPDASHQLRMPPWKWSLGRAMLMSLRLYFPV